MTISISNLVVSNDAPPGSIIGVLTTRDALGNVVPCTYTLTKGASGHFVISDDKLVTTWSMPAVPGFYSVRVRSIGVAERFSGAATFTVMVQTSAPPPPPPPPPPTGPSITVNGSNNAAVAQGAVVTVAVANGPGYAADWVALAITGTPDTSILTWDYLNGSHTLPDAGVTAVTVMMTAPMDEGAYEARFLLNNGYSVLARTSFTVQGTAPPPPSSSPPPPPPTSPPPPPPMALPVITVMPAMPIVPDTTPLGAVVATYAVAMDDGTTFSGIVNFGSPNYDGGGIFALAGNNIIVNPAGPGVGPNMKSIIDHVTLVATQ